MGAFHDHYHSAYRIFAGHSAWCVNVDQPLTIPVDGGACRKQPCDATADDPRVERAASCVAATGKAAHAAFVLFILRYYLLPELLDYEIWNFYQMPLEKLLIEAKADLGL